MLKDKLERLYTDIGLERAKSQDNNVFRASSAGRCARALAYQWLGYTPEPIQARGIRVFRHGDIIEEAIDKDCDLYKEKYGEDILTDRQLEGEFKLTDNKVVTCHIDGITKNNGEEIIVNIKTISDLGFRMIERGVIDYGHQCQAHCEMKAINEKYGKKIDKALYYYYKKNTSHDSEYIIHWDNKIMEEIEKRFISVLKCDKDNLPERELERHGGLKDKMGFPCTYCAYNKHCFPDREVQIIKGKPYICVEGYVEPEKKTKKKGE